VYKLWVDFYPVSHQCLGAAFLQGSKMLRDEHPGVCTERAGPVERG